MTAVADHTPRQQMGSGAADLYWLQRIHWQLFGTLTFKYPDESEGRMMRRWSCLFRKAAKLAKTPAEKTLWVLRRERGEKFGGVHLHFLMGGFAPETDLLRLARGVEACWRKKNGGRPQIAPYRPGPAGLYYILKNLDDPKGWFRESAKFTHCNGQLMVSHSVQRFLRKNYPADSGSIGTP